MPAKVPLDNLRLYKVQVLLTQNEYRMLVERAESEGISYSSYVRRLCRDDLGLSDRKKAR